MGTVVVRCCRLSAAPLTPFLEAGAVSIESVLVARRDSLGRWCQCGFSPCSSCYCSGVPVCGEEGGRCILFFPICFRLLWICDLHGKEGMILGLLVVPHAITLYLGMDFVKLILGCLCHCTFSELLWRAAWNSGFPQSLSLQ